MFFAKSIKLLSAKRSWNFKVLKKSPWEPFESFILNNWIINNVALTGRQHQTRSLLHTVHWSCNNNSKLYEMVVCFVSSSLCKEASQYLSKCTSLPSSTGHSWMSVSSSRRKPEPNSLCLTYSHGSCKSCKVMLSLKNHDIIRQTWEKCISKQEPIEDV